MRFYFLICLFFLLVIAHVSYSNKRHNLDTSHCEYICFHLHLRLTCRLSSATVDINLFKHHYYTSKLHNPKKQQSAVFLGKSRTTSCDNLVNSLEVIMTVNKCTSSFRAHLWCSYRKAKVKNLQVEYDAFRISITFPRCTNVTESSVSDKNDVCCYFKYCNVLIPTHCC